MFVKKKAAVCERGCLFLCGGIYESGECLWKGEAAYESGECLRKALAVYESSACLRKRCVFTKAVRVYESGACLRKAPPSTAPSPFKKILPPVFQSKIKIIIKDICKSCYPVAFVSGQQSFCAGIYMAVIRICAVIILHSQTAREKI